MKLKSNIDGSINSSSEFRDGRLDFLRFEPDDNVFEMLLESLCRAGLMVLFRR